MKTKNNYLIISALIFFSMAYTNCFSESFKSPGINGSTGLMTTPTAHTAWEGNDFAFDTGMHYIYSGNSYFIPMINFQILGKWEIAGAVDIQPGEDNNDLLVSTKFHFNTAGTDLAIGGNGQLINRNNNNNNNDDDSTYAFQVYLAATYGGDFFSMPAETTIVFGKTFEENLDSDIDFSMGFDLDFFPDAFQHYIHWINEFANYSYSIQPGGGNAESRGSFNTGLRIAVLRDSKFKLNFDIMMLDALDGERCFGAGAIFGMAF